MGPEVCCYGIDFPAVFIYLFTEGIDFLTVFIDFHFESVNLQRVQIDLIIQFLKFDINLPVQGRLPFQDHFEFIVHVFKQNFEVFFFHLFSLQKKRYMIPIMSPVSSQDLVVMQSLFHRSYGHIPKRWCPVEKPI